MSQVRMFVIILLVSAVAAVYGQERHGTETGTAPQLSIYKLPPLERAIRCTKYYEGWHGEKNTGPMWDGVIRFFPERVLPTTSQKLRETPSCERT